MGNEIWYNLPMFWTWSKKKTNKQTNRKNINKKPVVISNGIWGPCKIISWLSIESDDQTKHLQISLFINTSELYITVVHLKSARFSTTNSIYRWLGNWTRSQAWRMNYFKISISFLIDLIFQWVNIFLSLSLVSQWRFHLYRAFYM